MLNVMTDGGSRKIGDTEITTLYVHDEVWEQSRCYVDMEMKQNIQSTPKNGSCKHSLRS